MPWARWSWPASTGPSPPIREPLGPIMRPRAELTGETGGAVAEMDWADPGPDEVRHRPVDLQVDRPHPARVYDYLLGGKDNFAADREVAEAGLRANPNSRIPPRENRAFLRRAVRYLTAEAGISQFLDIGTGIPTSPNVHEIAQAIQPRARIVYVDNDPIVLAQARALLTTGPAGKTAYIDADLRDVDAVLGSADLRETLDLSQPVGLLLIAVLHFIPDEDDPWALADRLLAALPSGSYLALSHLTGDFDPAAWEEVVAGLDPVDPGVVSLPHWRPDPIEVGQASPSDAAVSVYGGIARKP